MFPHKFEEKPMICIVLSLTIDEKQTFYCVFVQKPGKTHVFVTLLQRQCIFSGNPSAKLQKTVSILVRNLHRYKKSSEQKVVHTDPHSRVHEIARDA
jgi:hypothetical protein